MIHAASQTFKKKKKHDTIYFSSIQIKDNITVTYSIWYLLCSVLSLIFFII